MQWLACRGMVLLVVGVALSGCGPMTPAPTAPPGTTSSSAPTASPETSAQGVSPTPAPAAAPTGRPGPTTTVPSETATLAPSVGVDFERQAGGPPAFEPIVAAHPTDPTRLAIAYYRFAANGDPLGAVLRVSHDGGRTWRDTTRRPWQGSGRFPGYHPAIAWGPGPTPGSARLYWVDTTDAADGAHRPSIAWSDDEGGTWSALYVERRTPAWIGGFPDVTVDNNPASPNHGAVYVTYNWLASRATGPGVRLLASADNGLTWQSLEIPKAPGPDGYPAAFRINERVRAGPDGSVHVACFQADLRAWDGGRIFARGPASNVGRIGFAHSRIVFDRTSGKLAIDGTVIAMTLGANAWTAFSAAAPGTDDNLVDPTWSLSLDVDPASGRVLLAVADYRLRADPAAPRGTVLVGRSDDGGARWSWVDLPPLGAVDERPQSGYRPSIVASAGMVIVFLRGITDVAVGTKPAAALPTIGAAYAVSADGGETFGAPKPISEVRWNAMALRPSTNGPGLRERAERLADGGIVYAWADGRLAEPPPAPGTGRGAVFVAVLRIG